MSASHQLSEFSFPLGQSEDYGSMFLWIIVVLLLCGGLFWSISLIRKRLKGDSDISGVPAAGFTLADIRQLHKDGQMSEEEYERAKAKILDMAKRQAEVKPAREMRSSKDLPPVL